MIVLICHACGATVRAPTKPRSEMQVETAAFYQAFGGRLRRLRQGHGWSQQDLADAYSEVVGRMTDYIYISKWERGVKRPRMETIHALARAMDVPLTRLLFDNER